jgi:spermidine synthase
VVTTLEAAGFRTAPYHALVPSFGEWGFILAGRQDFANAIPQGDFLRGAVAPKNTRFLTSETLPGLFVFPADMARLPAEVNQLNNQILVRYFEAEWRKVIR